MKYNKTTYIGWSYFLMDHLKGMLNLIRSSCDAEYLLVRIWPWMFLKFNMSPWLLVNQSNGFTTWKIKQTRDPWATSLTWLVEINKYICLKLWLGKGRGFSFEQNWLHFMQGCFVQRLVEFPKRWIYDHEKFSDKKTVVRWTTGNQKSSDELESGIFR